MDILIKVFLSAMWKTNIPGMMASYQTQQRVPDFRRYEIKDHLGNVRTVIADYKNPYTTSGSVSDWTYLANVKNISNMYPYGKSYGANATYDRTDDYRYGFNGMEKEKNISETGDITDFGARVYDDGSYMSRDKFESKFPFYSPYIHAANDPINVIDEDGNVWKVVNQLFRDDTKYAQTVISKMYDNKIKVDITNDIVTLGFQGSHNYETLDANQQKLFNTMQEVINSKKTVSHEIYIDEKYVYIGSYMRNNGGDDALAGIDFGDLEKYYDNNTTKQFSYGFLGHEIKEQHSRVLNFVMRNINNNGKGGNNYLVDHRIGSKLEEEINEYKIVLMAGSGEWAKKENFAMKNGITKHVVNLGGGTDFVSSTLRSIGIGGGEAPQLVTIETQYKNGVISNIEVKDGNTYNESTDEVVGK